MHEFIKSFLDSKMSIFEEYGAFKHKYLFLQEKKKKKKKKKNMLWPSGYSSETPHFWWVPTTITFLCVWWNMENIFGYPSYLEL